MWHLNGCKACDAGATQSPDVTGATAPLDDMSREDQEAYVNALGHLATTWDRIARRTGCSAPSWVGAVRRELVFTQDALSRKSGGD